MLYLNLINVSYIFLGKIFILKKMTPKLNTIFVVLLICSLGVISNKGRKSREYIRNLNSFIQQDASTIKFGSTRQPQTAPQSQYDPNQDEVQMFESSMSANVDISSYLSAPASTESTGCFFDTADNLIKILDEKVTKYSQICNLETKSELKGIKDLLSLSKKLGQFKGKLVNDSGYLPTLAEKIVFDSDLFPELSSVGTISSLRPDDLERAMSTILKESWQNFAQKQGYPIFMRDKAWILAQFGYAKEFLRAAYSSSTTCLPVNEDVKKIVDLVVIDLNEESNPLVVKQVIDKVTIDPYGFDFGGYALAFWVREDNSELYNPLKLLQGFKNNMEQFNFQLECCQVNHVLTIGDQQYNMRASPSCTEYAFVLMTFEKDCDSYLMHTIVRLSNTNVRYNITTTEKIPADVMENLLVIVSSNRITYPLLFTHFKYSASEELRILSKMTDTFFQTISAAIAKCKPSEGEEDCYYKSLDKKCQVCKPESFLAGGKCYKACPDGTYVYENVSCKVCEEGCFKCKDETTCEVCGEYHFLYQGDCYDYCPSGTYPVGRRCVVCDDNCLECASATQCRVCKPENYLYGGKCYTECPRKTYLDITDRKCKNCNSACSTCSSSDSCDSCEDLYYYYNHKECRKTCPTGTRADPVTRTCIPCMADCSRCSSDDTCDECNDKFYLVGQSKCKAECPAYTVPIKKICIDCGDKQNCELCSSSNVNQCLKCREPYVLLPDGTCSVDCNDFYYKDSNRVCQPCSDASCMRCSKDVCYECKPGSYLLEDRQCVSECPDQYIAVGNKCVKCTSSRCRKCSQQDLNICTSCYYPQFLKEGECVFQCGDYFYPDNDECKYCHEGCLTCTNGYSCETCDIEQGYYFKGGICTQDCGIGYRANRYTGQCERCTQDFCGSCVNSKEICDYCFEGYFLFNNFCYKDSCPVQSYLPTSDSVKCEPCPKNCDHCHSSLACDSCTMPFYLQGSECKGECDYYHYSDESRICRPCENTNCYRCNGDPKKCSQCQAPLIFYDGDCVAECPEGTYEKNGYCEKCSSRCQTCSGTANNCKTCPPYLVYDETSEEKCVVDCPDGKVKVNGVCEKCTSTFCKVCKPDDLSCCTVPFSPFFVDECNVRERCPDGKYPLGTNCYPCMEGCSRCNYADVCSSCSDGYYLQNGICVKDCGSGSIGYDRTCYKCGLGCEKCLNSDISCCTQCPPGRYLLGCDCLDECGTGYWANEYKCEKCYDNYCAKCSDKGAKCNKCRTGYVLYNGVCTPAPCPVGTTEIDGECLPCTVSGCSSCDISIKECTLCLPELVLVNDFQCDKVCPTGTFKKHLNNLLYYFYCANCPENCNVCTNEYQCSKCSTGYVLQGDRCQKFCNEGFYANENGECVPCRFAHCSECSSTDCFRCNDEFFLYDDIISGVEDRCYEKCPQGTYGTEDHTCQKCPLHCTSCKNKDTCDSCEYPFVLVNNRTCETQCTDGTVEINGKCELCVTDSRCKKCSTDKITCEQCKDELYLFGNNCVETCGTGTYIKDRNCYKCNSNCALCDNQYDCRECLPDYFLYNHECVETCPYGYYGANRVCYPCSNNCGGCQSKEQCDVCRPGSFLEEGYCVDHCSVGYYQYDQYSCRRCSDNCIKCNSYEECTACTELHYILNGYCVDTCPDGRLPVNGVCERCVDNCKTCGRTTSECSVCAPPFYKYMDYCVAECPAGYYADDYTCKKCGQNCASCKDGNTCSYCEPYYSLYEDKCISQCPYGYSSFNRVCERCLVEGCQECLQSTATCSTCLPGMYKYDGKCYSVCPVGTFPVEQYNICMACMTECKTCSNTYSCDSCPDDLLYDEGRCVDTCPDGEAPVNKTCEKCHSNGCKTCNSHNLDKCLSCNNGAYILEQEGKPDICVSDCGTGYYVESGFCRKCIDGCAQCDNGSTCKTCRYPSVWHEGICIGRCPDYYAEKDGVCVRCEGGNCLTCDNINRKKCKRCLYPYKIKNGECVAECGTGFYEITYSEISECKECPSNCASCLTKDVCSQCKPGYVLYEDQCILEPCPSQYVNVNGVCKKCGPNCLTCSPVDQSICTSCTAISYLHEDGHCGDCGIGHLGQNGKCTPCVDSNCKKCNPIDTCLVCLNNMVVFGKKCYEECPSGYYEDGNLICRECGDSKFCKECYPGAPNKCKVCKPGYFLYDYKCIETCPEGTFANFNNVCQPCSSNCRRCINEETCSVCRDTYGLDSLNRCVNCQGAHQVLVGEECKTCTDQSCASCSPDDLSYCKECDVKKVLYKGKCYDTCPIGTYLLGRICYDCEENCTECKDSITCYNCNPQTVEYYHDCIEKCPSGFANVGGHCKSCSSSLCKTCNPSNLDSCDECISPYILHEHKCLYECPSGMFYNSETKRCEQCVVGCSKCTNSQRCDQCGPNHYLMPVTGECVSECPSGYYIGALRTCQACQVTPCAKCCPNNPLLCLQCPPGHYSIYLSEYKSCVTQCPAGFYVNDQRCDRCSSHCISCNSGESCSVCEEPYKLFEGRCISKCPYGTVERNGECIYCSDSRCQSCYSDNVSRCQICDPLTSSLYNELCVSECPAHTYRFWNGVTYECKSCAPGCDACYNEEQCAKCLPGYYFYENTNTCTRCNSPLVVVNSVCRECKVDKCGLCQEGNSLKCKECLDQFVLYDDACYVDCPTGYYRDGKRCSKCTEGCAECSSATQCTKCDPEFVLYGTQCRNSCPEHFRINENRYCEKCNDDYCLSCTESKDVCNDCQFPYSLYHGKCVLNCPSGTRKYNRQCLDCPDDCSSCDLDKCTGCIDLRYLKDGKCVKDCGDTYYSYERECFKCSDENCLTCPDNTCSKCRIGTYLDILTGKCVKKCSEGYFGNDETGKCEECEEGCSYCTDAHTCIECLPQYNFYRGKCVKPCPAKTTSKNGQCVECHQSCCSQCAPNEPNVCLVAENGFFLLDTTCVETCPEGYYTDNGICRPCDSTCRKCKDRDTCLECKDNFVLDGVTCLIDCPPGKVKINGKCMNCADENCKVCANDLEKCYHCFPPFFEYKGMCYLEKDCPAGTYADTDTQQCVPCDPSCAKCTKYECLLCKSGWYYHLGQCLVNCPYGFYEDCSSTSRRCVACDSSCDGCVLGSNADCINCKPGFIWYNDRCISIASCPTGTFYDGTTCSRCPLPYCAECLSETICARCNRGFNVAEGKCLPGDTLTPIINDYVLVDGKTASDEELRQGETFEIMNYKGTGIGSQTVTLSFYFRSLQPTLEADLAILSVMNLKETAYDLKFIINHKTYACQLLVQDGDEVVSAINVASCSYDEVYNWRFFAITMVKKGKNFIAKVNLADTEGRIIEIEQEIEGKSHSNILETNSTIVLNYYKGKTVNPSNGAYHIGKLNIMDYYPTEAQLQKLMAYLPSNCDYFCTSCSDICFSCPNGVIPTNNRCPANFIREDPTLFVNPTTNQIYLRQILVDKLASDAYGFTQWIYYNKTQTEKYLVYRVDYDKSINSTPYLECVINNGQIEYNGEVINHEQFQPGNWYFIYVANQKGNTTIVVKDTKGYEYTQSVVIPFFVRQYNDFVYTLHTTESTYPVSAVLNTKIYVNNIPSEEDMRADFDEHKCSEKCKKCNAQLSCLVCEDGFVVEEGNCVENSPKEDEYVELENIYDLWNTDMKSYDIPFRENLTIAFNIRKKTHSNIYQNFNKYNLLSYADGNEIKSLITENLIAEYVSEYSLIGDDNSKQWRHDYAEEIYDFITVVIMVNKFQQEITFVINDYSTGNVIKFTDHFDKTILSLIIGDKNGYEMNTEITFLRVYDGMAGSSLQDALSAYPKHCTGFCDHCDFTTGLCNKCSYEEHPTEPKQCMVSSINWYPAHIFGYNEWKFDSPSKYVFPMANHFKININADKYTVRGAFQLFKLTEGARYRIGCARNDEFKVFTPANNRGADVLCIDASVKNGIASLTIIVNDGGEPVQIPINGFTFDNGEWVSFYGNVNANDMLLRYDVIKNLNVETRISGSYSYVHVPEKIQESSSLTIYGIADNIDRSVYSVPHLNIYILSLVPGQNYLANGVNKYNSNKLTPECEEGCEACAWDMKMAQGECFECKAGYDKKYVSEGRAVVTCTKSQHKVELYKGLIPYYKDISIKDKHILDGDFGIYFQILFNFPFFNYEGQVNILQAGNLKVYLQGEKLYALFEANSAELPYLKETMEIPLHNQYNKWNHVLIARVHDQLQITVQSETYTNTTAIETAVREWTFDLLQFKPIGYTLTFYSPAITTSTSMEFIKQRENFGFDTCSPDCALCERGVCQICGNGYNEDGSCAVKNMTYSPLYVKPDAKNVLYFISLLNKLDSARHIRIKSWTYQFSVDFDRLEDKEEEFFILGNYNGVDTITSTINTKKGILTIHLLPFEGIATSTTQDLTIQLSEEPKGTFFFVIISYNDEDKQFNVMFGENQYNESYDSIDVEGTLGPFAFQVAATIKGSVPAYINDMEFNYNTAAGYMDMYEKLQKASRMIQLSCEEGTPNSCTKCTNSTLVNGVCVPDRATKAIMTLFREYSQMNSKSNKQSFKTTIDDLSEYTGIFLFRLNSLTTKEFKIVKLSSDKEGDLLYVTYNPKTDKFGLTFPKMGQTVNAGPIFTTMPKTFDWVVVAFTHNVVTGSVFFKVTDLQYNTIFKGYQIIPTATHYASSTFRYTIGYDNAQEGAFEIAGLELFNVALEEEEFATYSFGGLHEVKYGCAKFVSGICVEALKSKEIELTKEGSHLELFTPIDGTLDQYYAFDNYLITLELDVNQFSKGDYTANPSTLFVLTDNNAAEVTSLYKTDVIPKEAITSGLSMTLVGETLTIKAPIIPASQEEKQAFTMQFTDLSRSNMYISLLASAKDNTLSLVVTFDGSSYFYDATFGNGQRITPVSLNTLVYTHPAVVSMNINFHSPRLEDAFLVEKMKDYKSQCAIGNKKSVCLDCNEGFKLYQPGCRMTILDQSNMSDQ